MTGKTVNIDVRLVGPFKRAYFDQQEISVPAGMSIRQLVEQLELPQVLLGTVLLNGLHATYDDLLNADDKVVFLQFVDGG